MNPSYPNSSTLGSLLHDLRGEVTTLLRQETALAKTEMSAKIHHLTQHLIQVAIGGLIAYAGLIILLFGLGDLVSATMVNAGLDPDVAAWLAPGLLGLAVAITGFVMFARARKALSADNLVPEQTLQSLQSLRSANPWGKSKLQTSHE